MHSSRGREHVASEPSSVLPSPEPALVGTIDAVAGVVVIAVVFYVFRSCV